MVEGIDISSWQGSNIDWTKVKASGIDFVFIKATQDSSYTNPYFQKHWQEARRQNIIRGAYHFFDPRVPVEKQVTHFVSKVKELQEGDLPPMLDLEVEAWWQSIPAADRLPLVFAWLQAVEAKLRLPPILYMGFYFARDILRTSGHHELLRYKLWTAHYTRKPGPLIAPPFKSWTFWQYTDRGRVPGVIGNVDKNRFAGTRADLLRLCKVSDIDRPA